jgi:hypothetical protein
MPFDSQGFLQLRDCKKGLVLYNRDRQNRLEAFLYGLFGYGSREACAGSQSKTARRH